MHAYPGRLFFQLFVERQFEPTTIEDQVSLLSRHGLIIDSEKELARWLECVSYFRLRSCSFPFKESGDEHQPLRSMSQKDLINHYEFDRRLRLTLIAGIDHVEILIRTQLGLHMTALNGANWYEDPKLFRDINRYYNDLKHIDREVSRSSEVFLIDFFKNHTSGDRPPSWMVLEVLSFGTISKLFENLKPGLQGKKGIIQRLGFKTGGGLYLGSWLKSLVTVRNLCAHHARVMNRTFVHTPRYARTIRNQAWHGRWPDARRVYTMLTIIGVIVETIPGGEEWKQQTIGLLRTCSRTAFDKMGVPDDWENELLWNRP